MEREVTHVLNFSADEIKLALIMRLEATDKPAPPASAPKVKFSLSDTGATLEWVEQCEMNL
jgi:hypothetical protein